MNTTFDEIYELSMGVIRDYKIDALFNAQDLTDFQNYMEIYLKRAIPKFTECQYSLEDIVNFTTKTFSETLTLTEQVILSDFLVIQWLNSKILDVTQMQLHLNDTDFKHYAESQNLKEKMNAREILREEVDNDMGKYGLKQVPWTDWGNGTFI